VNFQGAIKQINKPIIDIASLDIISSQHPQAQCGERNSVQYPFLRGAYFDLEQ
jgi:hypothetical protein